MAGDALLAAIIRIELRIKRLQRLLYRLKLEAYKAKHGPEQTH